jgi:hypothetical protein
MCRPNPRICIQPTSYLLQGLLEGPTRFGRAEKRSAVIATERYEMQAARFLKAP